MVESTVRSCALLALAVCGAADAWAQEVAATRPCSLVLGSLSLDAQANRHVFRGVRVSCEDVDIAADEATASEVLPQEGEWQFRGSIRIQVGSAVMTADTATFAFADNRLVSGALVGSPVTLEDLIPEENTVVRATAGRISYDNVARTARMEDGASLVLGTSEMSGCGDIIYDLDRGLVDSVSNCGEPFVITILPRSDDSAAEEPTTTQ